MMLELHGHNKSGLVLCVQIFSEILENTQVKVSHIKVSHVDLRDTIHLFGWHHYSHSFGTTVTSWLRVGCGHRHLGSNSSLTISWLSDLGLIPYLLQSSIILSKKKKEKQFIFLLRLVWHRLWYYWNDAHKTLGTYLILSEHEETSAIVRALHELLNVLLERVGRSSMNFWRIISLSPRT